MIISEKQIMQLLTVARTYAEELVNNDDMMGNVRGTQLLMFIDRITNQQSDELKVIEE
jgi:hypothetical protein